VFNSGQYFSTSMKWFTSFRAKLILTVFPVVAAVTTVALVLAERKFTSTYRRLFEEQFEEQVGMLTSAKKKRFEALSQVLQQKAQQPDVLAAIEKKDLKEVGQILKPQLENLAGERLQSEGANRPNPGPFQKIQRPNDAKGKFPQAPILSMYMVDEKGKVLGGSQQRPQLGMNMLAGASGDLGELRLKGVKMPWLGDRKLEDILKEQEVGYFHFQNADKSIDQVREAFITPLRDPKSNNFIGAFVFALPLPSRNESALFDQTKKSEFGEIMSGIWVENELVTTNIPQDKREEVAALLAEAVSKSGRTQRDISVPIDGVRHQIHYRILNPDSPFPIAAQVNLYSLAELDAEIFDLRRSVAGLGIFALLVALLIVLIISRSLSGPITQLAGATREIEQGNFEVRVPVSSRDELGRLASSFNQMAAGLSLQDKYRSVLHAVADRTVAQQLIEQTGRLGGEMRHVSMLFCDIRGFTTVTENMSPADVIELLNEHMTALTDIAYQHGGIVDKFVGDLIMVLFGAPTSTGADAVSAVQCAQSMMIVRRTLNQNSAHPLAIGIGIATGNVVAGCMGSDQRLSYTVLGHSVNLASRLCSIAQPGEIIMDDETHQDVRSLIQAAPMPPMQLKGISESVQPWCLSA